MLTRTQASTIDAWLVEDQARMSHLQEKSGKDQEDADETRKRAGLLTCSRRVYW